MEWFTALVNEFPEARPLQRNGVLTREQLVAFFDVSRKRFEDPEFKMLLCVGVRRGTDAQEMVNSMQKQIFEAMDVQADFGISYLSQVRRTYSNDPELLRIFYEFVHLEERALDEAELPDVAFRAKYEHLGKVRQQAEEHLAKMASLAPAEQQAYMAHVFRNMVTPAHSCSDPSCGNNAHRHGGGGAGPAPPGGMAAPPVAVLAERGETVVPQEGRPAPMAAAPQASGGMQR